MLAISAGGVAAIIAASFWALLTLFIALMLVNVFRVLESVKMMLDETREQTVPLLAEVRTTVSEVNKNLEHVDATLASVGQITKSAQRLTSVVEQTVSSPLIKIAAVGAGLSRAVRRGQKKAK